MIKTKYILVHPSYFGILENQELTTLHAKNLQFTRKLIKWRQIKSSSKLFGQEIQKYLRNKNYEHGNFNLFLLLQEMKIIEIFLGTE